MTVTATIVIITVASNIFWGTITRIILISISVMTVFAYQFYNRNSRHNYHKNRRAYEKQIINTVVFIRPCQLIKRFTNWFHCYTP